MAAARDQDIGRNVSSLGRDLDKHVAEGKLALVEASHIKAKQTAGLFTPSGPTEEEKVGETFQVAHRRDGTRCLGVVPTRHAWTEEEQP